MKKGWLLAWWLLLIGFISLSFFDAYFYPAFTVKKFHLAPEFVSYLLVWVEIILLSYLYWRKTTGRKIDNLLLFLSGQLLVLTSIFPLTLFVDHLRAIAATGHPEEIYTLYYHLNFDEILTFYSRWLTLSKIALFSLPLLADWPKVGKFLVLYTRKLIVHSSTVIKSSFVYFQMHFLIFLENWLAVFAPIMLLLFILSVLLDRWSISVSPIFDEVAYIALYLGSVSLVLRFLFKKRLSTPKESPLLLFFLVGALCVLLSSLFSPVGLSGNIVVAIFILVVVFVLTGDGK